MARVEEAPAWAVLAAVERPSPPTRWRFEEPVVTVPLAGALRVVILRVVAPAIRRRAGA